MQGSSPVSLQEVGGSSQVYTRDAPPMLKLEKLPNAPFAVGAKLNPKQTSPT